MLIIPTSDIFGKSCPLTIICVPTKISILLLVALSIKFFNSFLDEILSLSILNTFLFGNNSFTLFSTLCVPTPKGTKDGFSQQVLTESNF